MPAVIRIVPAVTHTIITITCIVPMSLVPSHSRPSCRDCHPHYYHPYRPRCQPQRPTVTRSIPTVTCTIITRTVPAVSPHRSHGRPHCPHCNRTAHTVTAPSTQYPHHHRCQPHHHRRHPHYHHLRHHHNTLVYYTGCRCEVGSLPPEHYLYYIQL